ncbi:hypothetical protein [Microbacterium halophytorum]|uniref:hypothetical protein n=1 Tax=Microbacterium halophytorum TaxID=2067568 RepID=UPI000CFB4485|nr:hypothetical protein [Microbacterium halophytorum]
MTDADLTTTRSNRTGKEIRATALAEVVAQAEGLISQFEEFADEWRDGFTLQIGWAPLWLREEDGGFTVLTRDFRNDPRTASTDDLTLAIWMMVSLMHTTQTAGVEPEDVAWDDRVICIDGWDTADLIQLTREAEHRVGDSGWLVDTSPPASRGEPAADDLTAIPVWRMLQLRPAVARALSLPSTTVTLVKGDQITAIFDVASRKPLFTGQL